MENLINYSDLAHDCDISPNTAKAWLSVLETSCIIKIVPPYYRNFNKRIIKIPKLYFYGSALACSLLDIKTADELSIRPIRRALFESFAISEIFKCYFNRSEQSPVYFWRDSQGREIDVIVGKIFGTTIPIEIKARKTVTDEFFKKRLSDWSEITQQADSLSYVIYNGEQIQHRKKDNLFPWDQIEKLMNDIYGIK